MTQPPPNPDPSSRQLIGILLAVAFLEFLGILAVVVNWLLREGGQP